MAKLLEGVPAELHKQVKSELAQLAELGIEVVSVSTITEGAPARYIFEFPAGDQQWKTRQVLEKAGWDVGQQMGEKNLRFYASKRSVHSEGWKV